MSSIILTPTSGADAPKSDFLSIALEMLDFEIQKLAKDPSKNETLADLRKKRESLNVEYLSLD